MLDLLSTVGQWVVVPAGVRPTAVIGLIVVTVAAAGIVLLARRPGPRTWVPLVAFVGSYLALLLASALMSSIEPIGYRYMSPIFGPIAIMVTAGLEALWTHTQVDRDTRRARRHAARLARAAVILVGLAFIGSNMLADVGFAAASSRSGVGFNSDEVQSSELAAAVGELPSKGGVASNDPITIYWVSGRQPIIGRGQSFGAPGLVQMISAKVVSGDLAYYAHFKEPRTNQGISIGDLRQAGLVLNEVARYRDGVLYALSPEPQP